MLKYIIEKVSGPLGLNPQVEADKLLLISKINTAAKELWDQTDLVGSLREQFFQVTTDEYEITLPFYVGQVRGIRSNGWATNVRINDMSPRYYYGSGYQSYSNFRLKPKQCLTRTVSNSAPMTISVPSAESVRITFTVRGTTANSHRASETAILEAGETEVELTKSFTDVSGFFKDVITENDCTLTDADDNVMSVIPNVLEEAQHCCLQILDQSLEGSTRNEQVFEVLYKLIALPFVDDYDTYTASEYDDAIAWKTLSHFYATKEGQEALSLGYAQQADKLVDDKDKDAQRGLIKPMQSLPNRFIRAMQTNSRYSYGTY